MYNVIESTFNVDKFFFGLLAISTENEPRRIMLFIFNNHCLKLDKFRTIVAIQARLAKKLASR